MKVFVWISFIYLLFAVQCNSQLAPLFLNDYEIALFSEEMILSSVIWLRPAYCLYEKWALNTLDPSVAQRQTSLIEIQVKTSGSNDTYAVPRKFSVPQCRSVFGEHPLTEEYIYEVGPDIQNLNGNQVVKILPGTEYMIRYVLYNAGGNQIAYTDWVKPFKTRDLPPSPNEITSSLQGRSGGMVVITVILSISMFMLLVGLAVVFGTHK